ncbi:hypothetical protein RSSM_03628 [Rhodopirellula sallentina SM41]|uniref:Uncharacterized protein n=1 Tax=Rhodopirellula sallentina SM41 TaxID=1263870 RepID=M5U0X7_9BACT|nr:hypothetical protein RSSM_03628 [Rhodopirellula sallentina SM41]
MIEKLFRRFDWVYRYGFHRIAFSKLSRSVSVAGRIVGRARGIFVVGVDVVETQRRHGIGGESGAERDQ